MRKFTAIKYQPGQLCQLVLALLILLSSFGWSVGTVKPAQAASPVASFPKNMVAAPAQVTTTEENQLQFSSSAYTLTEGEGPQRITVKRTGAGRGTITATVIITDGTTSVDDYDFAPPAASLDPSFAPAGSGPNDGDIFSVARQRDGKILVGGDFTAYSNRPQRFIVRLNPDGSVDPSFYGATVSHENDVSDIVVQKDGKILIRLTTYFYDRGQYFSYLLRLNPDGSRDPSFKAADYDSTSTISDIALQPNGKILLVGSFTLYNNSTQPHAIQLNPDGSLDTSFDFNSYGLNDNKVKNIAIQPDGKILEAGIFGTSSQLELRRFNPDGSRDPSFNLYSETISGTFSLDKTDPNNSKKILAGLQLQADGKIFLITRYALKEDDSGYGYKDITTTKTGLIRLNADGSLDTTFNATGISTNGAIASIVTQPDGQILIGGDFNSYNQSWAYRLIRINSDGSRDLALHSTGVGPDGSVSAMTVQKDGKIIIEGSFTNYAGVPRKGLARINPDGSLDLAYDPGEMPLSSNDVLALQPDDKLLFLYRPTSAIVNQLIRLNLDGSPDTTFNPSGIGANDLIKAVAVQPDGKIVLGGYFPKFAGSSHQNLIRLNLDGSLDQAFEPSGSGMADPEDQVSLLALSVQSDGKILVGGDFGTYNGKPCGGLVRLNSDGSLDPAFNFDRKYGGVSSIATQSDGKILIQFGDMLLPTREGVYRINPDGSDDTSFEIGYLGPIKTKYDQYDVAGFAVQADDQILISGGFTSYENYDGNNDFTPSVRNKIARLNDRNKVTLSWADGDMSPRSFLITPTDDTLYEPTETASFGLTQLQGEITATSPITASLAIQDNDQPTRLNILTGDHQSANVDQTFDLRLRVQLLNPANKPVSNMPITITAPALGASGTFTNGTNIYTATTNINGFIATTDFTANDTVGTYQVAAVTVGQVAPIKLTLTNLPITASVRLSSNANPIITGQNATFMAIVKLITPTTTVAFTLDNSPPVTVNLSGSVASYSTPNLSAGTHLVTATYGDSSTTITQEVSPPSSLSLASSAYTLMPGGATLITVTRTGTDRGTLSARLIITDVTTSANDYQINNTPAGSLDPTFNAGGRGPDNQVNKILMEPDGRILVKGIFDTYNEIPCKNLVQLNPDGSVNSCINLVNASPNTRIVGVDMQKNGELIVLTTDLTNRAALSSQLIRLYPDGSIDKTFQPTGIPSKSFIESIVVQPDDKILATGAAELDGKLMRLNADGTFDTSFKPMVQPDGSGTTAETSVAVQTDGKILVIGLSSFVGRSGEPLLARLNPDGSIDPTFHLDKVRPDFEPLELVKGQNGKLLIWGSFNTELREDYYQLVQLNPDGTFDKAFDISKAALNKWYRSGSMNTLAIQSNGDLLLGGGINGESVYEDRTQIPARDLFPWYLARVNLVNELTVSWSDGDNSPRSFLVQSTDNVPDGTVKTAELGLTDLSNGTIIGTVPTATLSIRGNATSSQPTGSKSSAEWLNLGHSLTFTTTLNTITGSEITSTNNTNTVLSQASILGGATTYSIGNIPWNSGQAYCAKSNFMQNHPMTLVQVVKLCA